MTIKNFRPLFKIRAPQSTYLKQKKPFGNEQFFIQTNTITTIFDTDLYSSAKNALPVLVLKNNLYPMFSIKCSTNNCKKITYFYIDMKICR